MDSVPLQGVGETMTKFLEASTEAVDARLHSLQPDSASEWSNVREVAWDSTDPVRLELCRLRLASLLGCPTALRSRTPAALEAGLTEERVQALAEWPDSPLFDAADRAHLAFAEQFSISVPHVSDEQVETLLGHLTPEEVCAFVNALYVVELGMRLHMTASAIMTIEEEE
jgi:alkylhydroperoxidase family enzyme